MTTIFLYSIFTFHIGSILIFFVVVLKTKKLLIRILTHILAKLQASLPQIFQKRTP